MRLGTRGGGGCRSVGSVEVRRRGCAVFCADSSILPLWRQNNWQGHAVSAGLLLITGPAAHLRAETLYRQTMASRGPQPCTLSLSLPPYIAGWTAAVKVRGKQNGVVRGGIKAN